MDGAMVWTIVVAGGSGARFGGPKQFEALGERTVIDWSVAVAEASSDGVVVVLPADRVVSSGQVAGGATRSASVRAGLAAVPAAAEIICVHDAARPFASPALYRRVIDAVVAGAAGAIPGVPVADTIKVVDEQDVVVATPPRDRLRAVQTPQAFRAEVLRAVHLGGPEATDDAALVEAAGHRVVVVAGEVDNRKLTVPADLDWARQRAATLGAR
jgi:2-C-methyl-D-erythritol 4-phosphate cytidylyltransferase